MPGIPGNDGQMGIKVMFFPFSLLMWTVFQT